MICCPMCLLLSVVICIMTDDSGIIPHAMNFLAPFTLHIRTTASFPGDAPSHNSIAQNLQGLHSRSEERMGKDRNCTLDKHGPSGKYEEKRNGHHATTSPCHAVPNDCLSISAPDSLWRFFPHYNYRNYSNLCFLMLF